MIEEYDAAVLERLKLEEEYEKAKDQIMAKVSDELTALNDEYAPLLMAARNVENFYAQEIKQEVLASGKSVKTRFSMFVYNLGRTTWNTAMLDGMIALVPEIAQACHVGEPYVVIRQVKK